MSEKRIIAQKVSQWLEEWDSFSYDEAQNRKKPNKEFYLFSISASDLRKMSRVNRRNADDGLTRSKDKGVQRVHSVERSEEIRRYVEGGHPWATLSEKERQSGKHDEVKNPGWLPTAIIVNFIQAGDIRDGYTFSDDDVICVRGNAELSNDSFSSLIFPESFENRPVEIIDGQHRVFAFDEDYAQDYQLPVVAFVGLDVSWQAYLFWTINIKPKRINASLAFDLYPLLREATWLEKGTVSKIYRENRAQELTEMLWSLDVSPWQYRINMLGGPKKEKGSVTQSAFINSLMNSFVRPWRVSSSGRTGGIFGGMVNDSEGIDWSRSQQAAFLVMAWMKIEEAIRSCQEDWAKNLRETPQDYEVEDNAFAGQYSLLATDQGVRSFMQVINDMCYEKALTSDLLNWYDPDFDDDVNEAHVEKLVDSAMKHQVADFVSDICQELAFFDWRTSGTPDLDADRARLQSVYKGSGGYSAFKRDLLVHLSKSDNDVSEIAEALLGVKNGK